MRPLVLFISIALGVCGQELKFEGRAVTTTEGKLDEDGFPLGPASICVDATPRKQCYTAPGEFGLAPNVELVRLNSRQTVLLFSAASGGVSGWVAHLAILRLGVGDKLDDSLLSGVKLSNQSQYAFWNEPEISEVPILVTADYQWGPDESHYGEHRYSIATYVLLPSSLRNEPAYYLDDEYLSVRRYDLDAQEDVLAAEKSEILSRLKRVKVERDKLRSKQ